MLEKLKPAKVFHYFEALTRIPRGSGNEKQVSGFLVDDRSWEIRELVVEAGHWYAGKKILVSPSKVKRISYEEAKVYVGLSKADIQQTAKNDHAKTSAQDRGVGPCCD